MIRVTSMHYMKLIRMFEDDVMWPEHAYFDSRRLTRGGLGS